MEGASDPVTLALALRRHPATILVDVVVSRQRIGIDAMPLPRPLAAYPIERGSVCRASCPNYGALNLFAACWLRSLGPCLADSIN